MKGDRGHRRRTRQGPCCRDRSCSSRTSRSPPRSCSSRTPCSTPATATVEAAVFGIKHYLRHQGVLCTVQVEKIWLEAEHSTLSLVEQPRPVIPPSGEKAQTQWKVKSEKAQTEWWGKARSEEKRRYCDLLLESDQSAHFRCIWWSRSCSQGSRRIWQSSPPRHCNTSEVNLKSQNLKTG